MNNSFELMPTDGRKSFYGKAHVSILPDGAQLLTSYNTDIMIREKGGSLVRLWDGWTATTGRHIKAFCGLNKADYMALPLKNGKTNAADMTWQDSLRAMYARRNAV